MARTLAALGLLAGMLLVGSCGGDTPDTCHSTKDCKGSKICDGDGLCVACTKLGDACGSSEECCGTSTCDSNGVRDVRTQF